METVTLEFLARQNERILAELAAIRSEQAAAREDRADTHADIIVLMNAVHRVERDMVRVKEMLGTLDARLSRLETERA